MKITKNIISTVLISAILLSSSSILSVEASANNNIVTTTSTEAAAKIATELTTEYVDKNYEATQSTETETDVVLNANPKAITKASSKSVVAKGIIKLSKAKLTVGVNESVKLTPTIIDTDNISQNIEWTSTDKSVISVDANGTITAKKTGTAIVTAKLENGSFDICEVTVKNAPTSVSLNKTSLTLGIGETYDLNSSLPSGCGAYSIKYSSQNTSVASVKAAGGLVTAKAVGTTTVTAKTYNGKYVTCKITVKKAPTKVSLNKTSLTLGIGEIYDLNSSLPSGTAAHSIVYTSNNSAVASVKAAGGLVTAKKVGTATITAKTYNGKTVTCKITVKNAPASVSLNKSKLSLNPSGSFDLNSSLTKNSASHSIVYSSSNPSVATVKAAGGIVTAKKAGTATITAKTFNGKTAKCTVTVTKEDYTDDDLYCLAAVIWQEAGATYCSDRLQLLVANVVMNHVKSPYFPNTIRGVITRKGAYGLMYWNGVSIPKANDPITKAAIDRCYSNAKKILDGYRILPENVIYQAGFVQGSGVYTYEEGMYFCYM